MRKRLMSLGFLVAAGTLLAAQPPRPAHMGSPAELGGARFYDADFAAKVYGGAFDPFEFWDHRPVSVFFSAPSAVEIDWGREVEHCTIRAEGGPVEFDLALDCGGTPRSAHWTWIEQGRVRTDLAYDEPELMIQMPQSYDELQAEHARSFAEKKLTELAGTYKDLDGNAAILAADGTLALGDSRFRVEVLECLNRSGPGAMPRVACLRVEGRGEPLLLGALPADNGAVLVEGRLLGAEESRDGRAFQPSPSARRYFRAS
jgi:hypothetical protein